MAQTGIDKREDLADQDDYPRLRESAPSIMQADQPAMPRFVGMVGLLLAVLGGAAVLMNFNGVRVLIGPTLATLFLVVGVGGLLFHAIGDPDIQVRRSFGGLGILLLLAGIVMAIVPLKGVTAALFTPGYLLMAVGLLFLLAFLRHETDPAARQLGVRVIGLVGVVMILTGFIGGSINHAFLVPYGVLLSLLGIAYLCGFIAAVGTSDDLGHRAAQLLGVVGGVAFLVALLRSIFQSPPYLVPDGLILMGLGLFYVIVCLGQTLDSPTLILARRELSAFFYSPMAYLVLVGMTWQSWSFFDDFLLALANGPAPEPIVQFYYIGWWPIIFSILAVPLLTMRLLSEEIRSGTMEVTLTAPIDESSMVIGKFIAALVYFLLVWVPSLLFLVALHVESGQSFDYRPLFSFAIALIVTGAMFVSMGLFFSSLASNQIISAVLTAAGMVVLTQFFFWKRDADTFGSTLTTLFGYGSYIDTWWSTLKGGLMIRQLMFPLSLTVIWLFATVKVLESRKWR